MFLFPTLSLSLYTHGWGWGHSRLHPLPTTTLSRLCWHQPMALQTLLTTNHNLLLVTAPKESFRSFVAWIILGFNIQTTRIVCVHIDMAPMNMLIPQNHVMLVNAFRWKWNGKLPLSKLHLRLQQNHRSKEDLGDKRCQAPQLYNRTMSFSCYLEFSINFS